MCKWGILVRGGTLTPTPTGIKLGYWYLYTKCYEGKIRMLIRYTSVTYKISYLRYKVRIAGLYVSLVV